MARVFGVRGILAVAAVLATSAFGQNRGGSPPTTGTTTTGTTTGTTSTTTGSTSTNPNNSPTTPSTQALPPRPVLITGRVMVDDGTPPPMGVVIERVCNSEPHAEGYTDGRGYFSISLGQRMEVMGDASESSNGSLRSNTNQTNGSTSGNGTNNAINPMGSNSGGFGGENRYANCDIRARIGGYRSQSVSLLNHSSLDNPDIGTILIHRLVENEEATTITASTLRASKPARKAAQKGMDLIKKKKTDEAIASFQEAVKTDPEFAFAWCQLGKLQNVKEQTEEARHSFEAAAKIEPRWPEPFMELALLAGLSKDWKSLSELSDHVLRLDSFSYPFAFFLNGVANYNLKHMDVAEKAVRSAQKLDTQHQYPQIERLLGTILLEHREYAAAADELRNYLVLAPHANDAAFVRKQLDGIERIALSDAAHKEQE